MEVLKLIQSMGKEDCVSVSHFCVSSGLRDAGSFHPHQHLIPLTLLGAKSTSLWFRLHVLMSHAGERLVAYSFLSMYFYSAPAQPRGALPRSLEPCSLAVVH